MTPPAALTPGALDEKPCRCFEDAALIAALRNAAPALIAEVRRARRVEEAARAFAAVTWDASNQSQWHEHYDALAAALDSKGGA